MGVDVQLHSLLILDLGENERSASLPGCFNAGGGVPHTHRLGAWMFFKESLDILGKRKSLATVRNWAIMSPTIHPWMLKEQEVTNQENWVSSSITLYTNSLITASYFPVSVLQISSHFSSALLKKLTVVLVVKEIHVFYETQRWITTFSKTSHWTSSWTNHTYWVDNLAPYIP